MTEPDFAEWRDKNMPESLSQLDPTSQVAEVERHDTHSDERHQ